MKELEKKTLINYYESCEVDYRRFWDLDRSMAMHAGFWDETTKTLAQALTRENDILAHLAEIKSSDKILDAGCGVGGSSIFLAQHYGCFVTGITLSEKQAQTAKVNAEKCEVSALTSFQTMDYCHTTFPNASFDVVWAIESVCHASDKDLFIKEAYRLLKHGGRLIIADGFATKASYDEIEKKKMNLWLNGWGVSSIEQIEIFHQKLRHNGFDTITFQDMTRYVLPSSRRLYWISFPAFIFSKMGEWLGMRSQMQTNNVKSAYYQYKTLEESLWCYGVFLAYKASKPVVSSR